MRGRYQAGGLGYGDVKKELLTSIESYFDAARTRRRELVARPDLVEDVLRAGAAKARAEAVKTLELVREAVGMRGRPLV
jgi:tryptophanyl-tRNA synthetase